MSVLAARYMNYIQVVGKFQKKKKSACRRKIVSQTFYTASSEEKIICIMGPGLK